MHCFLKHTCVVQGHFGALFRRGGPNPSSRFVVLEVPQEGSKATVDSERNTWRSLLHELETEASIVDVTINNHDLKRLNNGDGSILSRFANAEC